MTNVINLHDNYYLIFSNFNLLNFCGNKMEDETIRMKDSSSLYRPNERSKVTIELEGRLGCSEGHVLLPRQTHELTIGEADDEATVGLERLITTMRVGEVNDFVINCTTLPCPPFQLAQGVAESPQGPVWYNIRLVNCTRANESWRMAPHEKLDLANHHKVIGNERFKTGKHSAAARRYSKALKCLISISPLHISDEEKQQAAQLKMACLLNLAACQLKLNAFHNACKNCSKVLETHPGNLKALYRRGQALMFMNDLDLARQDLTEAQTLDPNNRAVNDMLKQLQSRDRQQKKRYHQALKSMFIGK